jgi:hypothetical protein
MGDQASTATLGEAPTDFARFGGFFAGLNN